MEFYSAMKMEPEKVAPPETIMSSLMEERRKLIMGHYGDPRNDEKKMDESLLPSHYAISLSGEPTMYPQLPQLIRYLKKLPTTKSVFLVTNGQEPEMLERLRDEDALPTQLYLSTNAPNREVFQMVNKPKYEDAWERWNVSLEIISRLDTRSVLRLTLIRGYNCSDELIPEYSKMIRDSRIHFIEAKSYMHIGRSTNRLERSDMLEISEVRHFAKELARQSEVYSVMDESDISRIVVLQNQKRLINRWITSYASTN